VSCEHVLVSGATGFVGSHLVLYLLKNSAAQVHCVVRSTAGVPARERLIRKLEGLLAGAVAGDARFGPLEPAAWQRLHVHAGDITRPRLGLEPADYEALRPTQIWHVAADVRFESHLRAEVFETNVVGTRNVLALARDKRANRLNYVSTAYVAGERAGFIEEGPVDATFPANNPYEDSKRTSELELAAAASATLRIRIMRPSVIIGHSKSMVGDPEAGLSAYLRVLFKVKETVERRMPDYFEHNPLRLGFEDSVTLNMVCVDHVVETMVRVAERADASPLDYHHIVNPRPTMISSYLRSLSEVLATRIVNVADVKTLGPIDHLLWMKTDVYRSYHRDSKIFDSARTLELAGVPAEALAVSEEDEKRYSRWVYDHYRADRSVERSRERSAVHLLRRERLSSDEKRSLSYFVGGDGQETLLLLNAYGQSLAFWDRAMPLLLRRFRVIAWQARGTSSQGGGITEVFPIAEHVEDLVAILQRERVDKCHVLAWCTGPKVALELNARLPGCLESLVFLTACFKGLPNVESCETDYERHMDVICRTLDQRPEVASAIMDILKRVITEKSTSQARGGDGYDARVDQVLAMVPEDIKPLVLEPFLTPDNVVSYARQLLSFWAHDSSDRLPCGEPPLLLVAGELDNIASPRISREVARRAPGAVYAEIAGGSHYMQYDNAELLVDIVERFTREPHGFEFDSQLVELERTPRLKRPPAPMAIARGAE
jgi:thioester reductase-like protein/pimeloyl-ACP methyl ester carboxylesterase